MLLKTSRDQNTPTKESSLGPSAGAAHILLCLQHLQRRQLWRDTRLHGYIWRGAVFTYTQLPPKHTHTGRFGEDNTYQITHNRHRFCRPSWNTEVEEIFRTETILFVMKEAKGADKPNHVNTLATKRQHGPIRETPRGVFETFNPGCTRRPMILVTSHAGRSRATWANLQDAEPILVEWNRRYSPTTFKIVEEQVRLRDEIYLTRKYQNSTTLVGTFLQSKTDSISRVGDEPSSTHKGIVSRCTRSLFTKTDLTYQ